jgi:hypothetical protein
MSTLTTMPRDLRAVHFCPTCCSAYESREAAEECAAIDLRPGFNVGDIVRPAYTERFGWHDGLDHWVLPHKAGKCYDFYYVVTAIGTRADIDRPRPFHNAHPSQHRPLYWVRTLAMREGYSGGWTDDKTHVAFVKVDDPPALVVEESRPLVGWRENHLL